MEIALLIAIAGVVWLVLRLRPMLGQIHIARLERFHASLAADRRKVVVCMGDSLTHGNASFDYVHELARRLEPSGYTVLNAGVNSELAWNLLQRMDSVVRSEPAYVVLLVGTNDARGSESEWAARRYVRRMKLPQSPDEAFFRESHRALLDSLADSDCTRTILATLPPLGERSGEPIDEVVARFNAIIEQEAALRGLPCLPLNTALREALASQPGDDRPAYDARRSEHLAIKAVLQHHVLGWGWDRISERSGMTHLTDMIHLNDRGGHILVDLVEAEIKGVPAADC